jgi:hypothetical protein
VVPPKRDPLTTALALIISVVWATIALASIVIREYAALTIVTPVMLVVAGFLFGLRVTKNGDVGKD